MARLGVQPDAMAATALIDACARNGKMDMAMSVFDELFGARSLSSSFRRFLAPFFLARHSLPRMEDEIGCCEAASNSRLIRKSGGHTEVQSDGR